MIRPAVERLAIAGVVLALFSVLAIADTKPPAMTRKAGPITVTATPITTFTRQSLSSAKVFGKLEFVGGLLLTVPDEPNFGGWSGLALDADAKRFVAVSDAGAWLTGAMTYKDGVVTGLTDTQMGPLLGMDGAPLQRRRDRDSEAVARVSGNLSNGRIQIAFEQNARVHSYPIKANGVGKPDKTLPNPKNLNGMRRNSGFEAMTVVAGGPNNGATVVIAERFLDLSRNHTGWMWTPRGIEKFTMTNIGDYDVTDIASLDDGTLFVLERRFRWIEGVKMRLRKIAASELKPGQTVSGETLLEASMDKEIDNMEGLAVTRTTGGAVLLTIISDDNFNRNLQRNLLLQFRLPANPA